MLLNRFSFLCFQPLRRPEPSDLPGQPVIGADSAPGAATVVVVPGESYQVYIPFDVDPNLISADINLVGQSDQLVVANFGQITGLTNTDHVLISFSLDKNALIQPGYYLLRLTGTAGRIYSNRIWVRNSGYEDTSALFRWTNTRSVGPIDYEDPVLPPEYYNQLRLKCQSKVAQSDTSIEEYEQVTTGQKVPVNIKSHKVLPFTCPNTDGFGHEGWQTLLAHRKILLNGQAVSTKTGYTVGDGAGTLATGSFELWDTAYSILNRC